MRKMLLAAALAFSVVALPGIATNAAEPAPHGEAASDAAHGASADAHGEGEHADAGHGEPIVAKLVNTLIFFGLLGWFAGPWIAAYFRKRKAEIATELGAAQAAREEAEAKLAQMEARLAEVDGEVDGILEKAGRQAEAEKERILAAAKAEAGRVLEQAETQVGEFEAQAVQRLRGEAATLAVDLARGLVTKELADSDRAKLFNDYLAGLEKAAS